MFASFLDPDGSHGRRLGLARSRPVWSRNGPVMLRTQHGAAHARTLGVLVLTYFVYIYTHIHIYIHMYTYIYIYPILLPFIPCTYACDSIYLAIIDTSLPSTRAIPYCISCLFVYLLPLRLSISLHACVHILICTYILLTSVHVSVSLSLYVSLPF